MKAGVYVHIPFCKTKCNYCSFYSVVKQSGQEFLTALATEFKLLKDRYDFSAETIYLGGGTPTVLNLDELEQLLALINDQLDTTGVEFSIEANPATINRAKLELLKEAGVNRLSLGVQSFSDPILKFLGRNHSQQDILTAYDLARQLDYKNISFDLISAIPNQSLTTWQNDLKKAVRLKPEHISTYNLKLEPGTVLYQKLKDGEIKKVSKELDLKMYQFALAYLEEHGFKHYEISNFAQNGFAAKHNKIYWQSKPYLAFGPGAHFFDGQARGYNVSSLKDYCQQLRKGKLAWAEYNKLSYSEQIEDYLIMGLRLKRGISITDFKERFNRSIFSLYQAELDKLSEQKLITVKGDRIYLTEQGILLANQVLAEFL